MMAAQIKHTLALLLAVVALSGFAAAQQVNQTFKREVRFQKIVDGKVRGEYVRRSQFTRDDRGRLVETILHELSNLEGVSAKDVVRFGSGKDVKPRPGIQMISRDYRFREFGAEVEVKDAWDAHWPKGAKVKVWFSSDFSSDRETLIKVLDLWNSLVPEVQFSFVGVAEEVQLCDSCLTVLRNPNLKDGGTFEPAHRGDGLIVYGRIYLRRLDKDTLFSIFAHEIGHSLGLPHGRGLMREDLPRAKRVFPSKEEVEMVRAILKL